jgi:hypothetical protein
MIGQQLKEVYILGAGFSKAVSSFMPLTNELGREIAEKYARRDELPHGLKAKLPKNFEAVLTELAVESLHCKSARLLYSDFIDCIRAIMHHRSRAPEVWPSDTPPPWLDALVEFWSANGTTVICLNYDTIIERVASGVYSIARHVATPTTSSLYGVPFKRIDSSDEPNAVATFRLLKVHGSINWFFSGEQDFRNEQLFYIPCENGLGGLYDAWAGNDCEADYWRKIGTKKPMIIPPVITKTPFYNSAFLQMVRNLAREAVRNADRIVCMGYSLPKGDLDMRDLLRAGCVGKQIPFEVVNPTNLLSHYSGLLGCDQYRFSQFGESDLNCIRKHVISRCIPNLEMRRFVTNMMA